MVLASTPPSDFATFFRAEFDALVRSVQRVAGPSAEDVVQEAFIVAYGRWDQVAVLDAPDAWVRLVARRIAWRRHGRESDRGRREKVAGDGRLAATIDEHDRLDLERAMDGLSARERALIRLHYLADLPLSQVAELVGCTEGAAKIGLLRARDRLADVLAGHRGSWTSATAWDADDIVAALRTNGHEQHADVVVEEIPARGQRWTLVFDRGCYSYDLEDGLNLDRGRYSMRSGVLRLRPSTGRGHVIIKPAVDGGLARFRLVEDTTPPTRDVPDAVYLQLLLESTAFDRSTPAPDDRRGM